MSYLRPIAVALASMLASCSHVEPEVKPSDLGAFMDGMRIDAVHLTPVSFGVEFTLRNTSASGICIYRDYLSEDSQMPRVYLKTAKDRLLPDVPFGFLTAQDHTLVTIPPGESLRLKTSNLSHHPKYLRNPENLFLAVGVSIVQCDGSHKGTRVMSEWVELSRWTNGGDETNR